MNKEMISKSVIKFILNTYIIKKRIYIEKKNKHLKEITNILPEVYHGWANDNWLQNIEYRKRKKQV